MTNKAERTPNDIPSLERPSFFDGQRLTAHDLAAAQDFNRELHWLHNRSLHGWGIAFGFAVSGAGGSQAVRIEPGYALDCMGRDLILDGALEMPVPAVASARDGGPATYYLTASYAEDEQLPPVTRAGACRTSGAVRRPEAPLVRWQDPADTDPAGSYRFGLDVVLASVSIQNCRLAQAASTRERRDAVPAQQPYIASGRTDVGATAWRLWPDEKTAIGVAATVTTSSAGFRSTPRYQADIAGERMFQAPGGKETFIVDGYPQIAQASAASFEVRVLLPGGTSAGIGQAEPFTLEDYRAVLSRITNANPAVPAELILAFNGPLLSPGRPVTAVLPFFQFLGQLQPSDFRQPLEKISQRKGISLDQLLAANGWDKGLNNVVLVLGQNIAIPGPALALNPALVFKPGFMDVLKDDLAWHVTWMGVEG